MHRHHVDAELAKGGGWIYPEGEGTGEQITTTSHEEAVAAYLQQAGSGAVFEGSDGVVVIKYPVSV